MTHNLCSYDACGRGEDATSDGRQWRCVLASPHHPSALGADFAAPFETGVRNYNGSLDCARKLTAAEGPGALFKGLPPALVRQSTYGSLRYGLYAPIKNAMGITPGQPVPLWKKIVAGGAAGAVASAVANPTDLMKVRLQTDGMMKDAEGKLLPKRYTGMVDAFFSIIKDEGVLGLWTGVGPTMGRATVSHLSIN